MTRSLPDGDEQTLVAAARAGDEQAFRHLAERYHREIHLHCYRMLGSFADAEDLVQETLLCAWRGLPRFQGRASFRAWLYKIATNVCLKALARRPRQSSPRVGPPVSTGTTTLSPPIAELIHLQPYPDALLDDAREADPAARYLEREGIELAFIVAIQHLPPRQRAVLILREVLGWSAAECADLLDISVPTVTSALQRARVRIAKLGPEAMTPKPLSDDVERLLLRRYVDAWHRADIPALVALLREDAVMTMPPSPTWFLGRDAIGAFFASSPADGQSIDRMRLLETRANGRPTLAAYRADSAGVHRPYGLMVLTIDGDSISEITGFPEQGLFAAFGLPAAL